VGFHDELVAEAVRIEAKAKAYVEGEGEAWPRPFEPFVPDLTVRATTRLAMGPFEAISYHVPGHCATQIALHVPDIGVFVAADMLSDIEIPWLEGPPWVYRATLKALMHVFEHEDIRTLVPGHGSIATGRHAAYQRLLDDFAYVHQLQEMVDHAFREGFPLEETQTRVRWSDPTGRLHLPEMQKVHRENVRLAYEALADQAEERRS
jgi:glyoxylase-like metal-dependent hydrolase (beta-lactamase superfamily II)